MVSVDLLQAVLHVMVEHDDDWLLWPRFALAARRDRGVPGPRELARADGVPPLPRRQL